MALFALRERRPPVLGRDLAGPRGRVCGYLMNLLLLSDLGVLSRGFGREYPSVSSGAIWVE